MLKFADLNLQKKFPDITLEQQIDKLKEEVLEVEKAETPEEVVAETLDVIQAAFGLLGMYEEKGLVDMKKANIEHLRKLQERKWTFEGTFNIERKEN